MNITQITELRKKNLLARNDLTPIERDDKELSFKRIPQALKDLDRFVNWRAVEDEDTGKIKKPPIHPITGHPMDATNPINWLPFDEAIALYRDASNYLAGIGFELIKDDPFTGIDFDNCLDENGIITNPAVTNILKHFDGYKEISPSKTGIRLIVRGKLPGPALKEDWIELYDHNRYVTLTGDELPGSNPDLPDQQTALTEFYEGYKHTEEDERIVTNGNTGGVCPTDALTDDQLRAKIAKGKNGARYTRLINGDWSDYGSQSEAELALCGILAFWTGKNRERIDRMFRESALYRDKWDKARGDSTYGENTINLAIKNTKETYTGPGTVNGANHTGPALNGPTEAPEGSAYNLTDLGNSERFIKQHGQNVRFVPALGIYLIWNGTHWVKDESLEIERLAKQTIKSIYSEAGEATGKDSQEIAKWAIRSESRDRLTAMLAHARSELVISHEALDKRPDLLPCTNGTIDLKTGALIPSERAHLMTKCLPFAYDPTATCSLWEKSINHWMGGDQEMIGFIQRAIGYSATGYTTEQCLFFTYGNGSNGKSVLVETVKAALGDFAQKAPTSMIMSKPTGNEGIPNDIARLPGARFAVTAELEKGQRLAESRVKDLTGGDTLTARFMRGEFFEFEPTHKLWIYGNHKPVIRGSDDGIWRRIRLVPFEVKIDEKDKDYTLKEKLHKELAGILAWIVRGCLEWQKQGLKPPDKVTAATDEYRSEMDTLGAFFDEFCEIKPKFKISLKEIYHAYEEWCDDSNEHPMTSAKFSTALTERGFKSEPGTANKTLKIGLKLRSDLKRKRIFVP